MNQVTLIPEVILIYWYLDKYTCRALVTDIGFALNGVDTGSKVVIAGRIKLCAEVI